MIFLYLRVMKASFLTPFLFLILLAFGCKDDGCVVPSDKPTNYTLTTGGFNRVVLLGEANLFFEQDSNAFSAIIRGSDNIIPLWTSFLTDSTLFISLRSGVCVDQNDVSFNFIMPEIKSVQVTGNSNMLFTRTTGERLDISCFGYSTIRLDSCRYQSINYLNTGSGNLLGFSSPVDSMEVNISGNARAEVNVIEHLWVRIIGSGKVIYEGDPEIREFITGEGTVKPR